jgi:Fe-S-cluster containining protein
LDPAWSQGWVSANRCVFLGADNACRNYENRPAVCRKHSVVSPVIECEKPGGQPVPKVMPLAEIIMSAAANQIENDFAALPKMLQRELDRRQSDEVILPLTARLPEEIL